MTLAFSLAFALAVFLFAATPGPAILACVAQALGSGFRSALALAAGVVLGDVIFLLMAIYGLAFISTTLERLFVGIRVVGGAYLLWMGWRMWTTDAAAAKVRPAFLDLAALRPGDVIWATALTVTVLMAVNSTYAWTAARARGWVTGATAVRRLNRGAGSLLMAIGVFVMVKR